VRLVRTAEETAGVVLSLVLAGHEPVEVDKALNEVIAMRTENHAVGALDP
jgi:hypothetical protein